MAPSAAVALLALAVCSLPRAQFHAIQVSTASPPSGAVATPKENAEDASEEKGILPWFSVPRVDSLPPGSQGSNFSSLSDSQESNISSPTGLQGDGVSGVELQSALDDSSVRNSPCDGDSADCGKGSSNPDKVAAGEHSNLKDSVANSTDASTVQDDTGTRFSSDWSEIQDITQERPHRLNTTKFVTPDPLRNTSPVNLTQPQTNSTTISTTVVITTTVDTRNTTLPPAPVSSKARGNPPSEKPGGSESQKPRGHATVGKKNASTTKTSVSSQPTHHLARHFTGFVQHVWLPNSTPRPPGPIDDGPFGSILWRDKKYLISVLIPIGVGFAGAMMIIVMAYASRAWRKRKERQAHAQGTPRSFLEAATSKNDDTAPLQESSDDEF